MGNETREFEWKYAGKSPERAREEENDDDNFSRRIYYEVPSLHFFYKRYCGFCNAATAAADVLCLLLLPQKSARSCVVIGGTPFQTCFEVGKKSRMVWWRDMLELIPDACAGESDLSSILVEFWGTHHEHDGPVHKEYMIH
ncbi:unnamed protein product [Sphagnum jensenii]|uniref:Uncharacterized protein n=1 Tax=Sphagnum jensenii TaxID=128206 RepID=A0ABP1BQ09_9BRYO